MWKVKQKVKKKDEKEGRKIKEQGNENFLNSKKIKEIKIRKLAFRLLNCILFDFFVCVQKGNL